MTDLQFRALLNLWMCSDPWPCAEVDHEIIGLMIDEESEKRGFESWVEAYHKFLFIMEPTPSTPKLDLEAIREAAKAVFKTNQTGALYSLVIDGIDYIGMFYVDAIYQTEKRRIERLSECWNATREILFRGYDRKAKRWRYGVPVEIRGRMLIACYFTTSDMLEYTFVDQSTIGQFTDRIVDGEKVFDGDLLLQTFDDGSSRTLEVFYSDEHGEWWVRDLTACKVNHKRDYHLFEQYFRKSWIGLEMMKRIGTIHTDGDKSIWPEKHEKQRIEKLLSENDWNALYMNKPYIDTDGEDKS